MRTAYAYVNENGNYVTEMNDFKVISGGTDHPSPGTTMIGALLNWSVAVLRGFCEKRDISTDGLGIDFEGDYNADEKYYTAMRYKVSLPEDFPEKYESSISRILNACTVGNMMRNLPDIDVEIV